MSIDYRAELQRLLGAVENDVIDTNDGLRFQAAVNRARTALAQPEPEGVTDDDLLHIFYLHCDSDDSSLGVEYWLHEQEFLMAARAVLARYARPAIEPVPVAERPWEREG